MIPALLLLGTVRISCPPGPAWTRERQQRAPVTEPAPVTEVHLEQDGVQLVPARSGGWRLDPTQPYALICSYAEGADSIVLGKGVGRLRVIR